MMYFVFHILRQLKRRLPYILLLPLVVGGSLYWVLSKKPSSFTSESSIQLNLPTNKSLSLSNTEIKQHEIATYFSDLSELIQSKRTLEMVRLSYLKDELQGKRSPFVFKHSSLDEQKKATFLERVDSLRTHLIMLDVRDDLDSEINYFLREAGLSYEALSKSFKFFRIGNSNYVRLAVTLNEPFETAYRARLIISALMEIHRFNKQSRMISDKEMFERLVENARQELNERVKKLEKYKIKNNIINLPEHTKAIVNQMVELEIQKSKLVETIAAREEALREIQKQLGGTTDIPLNVEANRALVQLQQELRTLNESGKSDVEKLQRSREIQQEITQRLNEFVKDTPIDIKATRQDLVAQYIGFKLDLEMSRQMLPLIVGEVKRIRDYANTFAPLESNISTLDREIGTAQESYLILLNKLNLAKTLQEGGSDSQLTVIDQPSIPLEPEPSKKKIIVILGTFVTGILVVGFIVVIEYLDSGVWNRLRFENAYDRTIAAGIPLFPEEKPLKDEYLSDSLRHIQREQLKLLHHKISTDHDNKPFLLISSLEGEGKSFLLDLWKELNLSGECVEVPAMENESEWIAAIEQYPRIIWIVRAGRSRNPLDDQLMNAVSAERLFPVLNAIPADHIDDLGMKVHKKRSSFRQLIKRLFLFNFKQKNV